MSYEHICTNCFADAIGDGGLEFGVQLPVPDPIWTQRVELTVQANVLHGHYQPDDWFDGDDEAGGVPLPGGEMVLVRQQE